MLPPDHPGTLVISIKPFGPILKQRIMHAIHRTKEVYCLSSTQKIGIVQIIPKADKNLKLLTNWRPLTLLFTFYELISGVLAKRLKTVLDHLIGPEQKGYVPLRFMGEVTKTTYDLFQYAQEKTSPGSSCLLILRRPLRVWVSQWLTPLLNCLGLDNITETGSRSYWKTFMLV